MICQEYGCKVRKRLQRIQVGNEKKNKKKKRWFVNKSAGAKESGSVEKSRKVQKGEKIRMNKSREREREKEEMGQSDGGRRAELHSEWLKEWLLEI